MSKRKQWMHAAAAVCAALCGLAAMVLFMRGLYVISQGSSTTHLENDQYALTAIVCSLWLSADRIAQKQWGRILAAVVLAAQIALLVWMILWNGGVVSSSAANAYLYAETSYSPLLLGIAVLTLLANLAWWWEKKNAAQKAEKKF